MKAIVDYIKCARRMRRGTFIQIIVAYWIVGAVLSFWLPPVFLNPPQNYMEIIYATPINYFLFGMLATILVLPAYAARLMDMAVAPVYVVLFLLPFGLNLAIKNGVAIPSAIVVTSSAAVLLAEITMVICRGTRGTNRYGRDPVD